MDDVLKLDFLGGLQRTGIVPGLERMKSLTAALGEPQKKYPVIIVTGTNGKGSTTCMVESVFRAAGLRTGRFTSPHLVDVRERIFIGGEMIDGGTFARLGSTLGRTMETRSLEATFFEALSAIGFMAFAEAGVDVAVVEVGMGGRLDSTNVAEPVVSVLSSVGLDHTGFLGSTVEAIALEKCGVARAGRPFVTGVDDPLFESTVGPELARIGARPLRKGVDFRCFCGVNGLDYEGGGRVLRGLVSGLAGSWQAFNMCLAVATVDAFAQETGASVPDEAIRDGLCKSVWPGRFQKVSSRPDVILDGCHNVHGAEALRVDAAGLARPLVLVHGTRPEKDYEGVLSVMVPLADAIVHTGFDGGADPAVVAGVSGSCVKSGVAVHVRSRPEEAVALATGLAGESGTVLVFGSLYMIGEFMRTRGIIPGADGGA